MLGYRNKHGLLWWLLLGWWLWCITLPFSILWWLFRLFITLLSTMFGWFFLLPEKIKRSKERERFYAEQEEWKRKIESSRIAETDGMSGHDFEHWCAALLRKNGFQNVVVTPGSGDQGVDITAYKNGTKYAVQCKCFKNKLGNTPVQEVVAGCAYYDCDKAVVMTNSYFTKGACDLAARNGVVLWDRDDLIEMMQTQNEKRPH